MGSRNQIDNRVSRQIRRGDLSSEVEETVIRIDRLLGEGLSEADACAYVGISRRTLRRWQLQLGLRGKPSPQRSLATGTHPLQISRHRKVSPRRSLRHDGPSKQLIAHTVE